MKSANALYVTSLYISILLVVHPNSAGADEPTAIKNVLFIVADDLRANVLGCYGDEFCKTPNIDRLAKSGLLFEKAYCQGTWCAPSRLSFMHSRYAGSTGVNMGEHFQTNGWYTARVGKIYHMRVPGDIIAGTHGLDIASSWTERFNVPGREAHTPGDYACLNQNVFTRSQKDRQSTRMPHRPFVSVVCDGDGSDQPDYKAASKAIELLQKNRNGKFFLAVGLVRPHYPMVAPQAYFDLYPHEQMQLPPTRHGDLDDIPKQGLAATNNRNNAIGRYPANQKRMWSAYYAAVSFMDTQVGRIVNALEELGLRDSTAIIFTSDHGYHLGDHGFWQKANLHEEVIRVPLVISVPGMQVGRSAALAELTDIYPTACELVGLRTPTELQGESLLPVLNDKTAHVRDAALSLDNGNYSLRSSIWHYIRYSDGQEEFYDMEVDPSEFDNLVIDQPKHAQLEKMRKQLNQKLRLLGLAP